MSVSVAIRATADGRVLEVDGRAKAGLSEAEAGAKADELLGRVRPFLVAAIAGTGNGDGLSYVSFTADYAFARACFQIMCEREPAKFSLAMLPRKGIWVPPSIFPLARQRIGRPEGDEA